MRETLKQLAESYGYDFISENKNPIMNSYRNENMARINYYYTSGTITLQFNGKIYTIRDSQEEDWENLLKKGNETT